jgi:tRNA A58 N-methylase Trm61
MRRSETTSPSGTTSSALSCGVVEEYEATEPLSSRTSAMSLGRIRESLVKLGRRVGTIAGASGFSQHADRERTRVDFQAGVLDAVVVQIRAAIAISLARARTAIYYSGTSSLIDYDQSRARIADQGAGSIALIHLLARGTVDEDQLVALRERVDIVKQMRKRLRETAVSR